MKATKSSHKSSECEEENVVTNENEKEGIEDMNVNVNSAAKE